ncbi:MAG TPA: hypothetical protein VL133_05235, partial [Devosia sp.]|nr:hypothetical protein [Devosia sp.]
IVKRAIGPIAAMTFDRLANFEGDPRLALKMVIGGLIEALRDPKRIAIPKLIMREALQAPSIAEMYRREVLASPFRR